MNKAQSNIKKGTNKVNIASVLTNYFLGGMVRALKLCRIRSAVVPAKKGNKYEPHQGKKECARRLAKGG